MKLMKRYLGSICLLGLLAILSGCVTEPSALTGESRSYGYTWRQELELGRTSDAHLIQQMGLYPDDALASYVTSIGESVLAQSSLRRVGTPEIYRNLEFKFRVMDSPVVNAFALPGGYVYVTRGLLAHLSNEAQLAVVLGHEITHVAARHASQQALKQQWGQIGLVAGAVIGQGITGNEQFADQFMGWGGSVFQMLTLKYGRDAERESDIYGVEYSAKAGYAIGESADFFNSLGRISAKSGQSLPSWQSSHPGAGEREGRIRQLAIDWGNTFPDLKVGEAEYLKEIDGLIIGENPRSGIVMRGKFYHADMGFQFDIPEGWQAKKEASSVTLVDPAGRGILVFSVGKGSTPEEAARNFVTSSKVEPLRFGKSTIGGRKGYVVENSVATSNGNMLVRNEFLSHRGEVFGFLSYSKVEESKRYRSAFSSVSESFGEIGNASIRDIEPTRLKVVTAKKQDRFSNFIGTEFPYGMDETDLAIINQIELNTVVEPGEKLKIVGN
ncbi:MAG: M48 family metalloprotease [Opitutales bacterium]|nr:M48 family metalloprotease [Opitutales bacterium]